MIVPSNNLQNIIKLPHGYDGDIDDAGIPIVNALNYPHDSPPQKRLGMLSILDGDLEHVVISSILSIRRGNTCLIYSKVIKHIIKLIDTKYGKQDVDELMNQIDSFLRTEYDLAEILITMRFYNIRVRLLEILDLIESRNGCECKYNYRTSYYIKCCIDENEVKLVKYCHEVDVVEGISDQYNRIVNEFDAKVDIAIIHRERNTNFSCEYPKRTDQIQKSILSYLQFKLRFNKTELLSVINSFHTKMIKKHNFSRSNAKFALTFITSLFDAILNHSISPLLESEEIESILGKCGAVYHEIPLELLINKKYDSKAFSEQTNDIHYFLKMLRETYPRQSEVIDHYSNITYRNQLLRVRFLDELDQGRYFMKFKPLWALSEAKFESCFRFESEIPSTIKVEIFPLEQIPEGMTRGTYCQWKNKFLIYENVQNAIKECSSESCAICTMELPSDLTELAILSGCKHVYCHGCIETWFNSILSVNNCPYCSIVSGTYIRCSEFEETKKIVLEAIDLNKIQRKKDSST